MKRFPFLFLLLRLVLFTGMLPAGLGAAWAAQTGDLSMRAEQPYFQKTQRETAGALARAEARAGLYSALSKDLASRPDIRFATSPDPEESATITLRALARAAFDVRETTRFIEKNETAGTAVAEIRVTASVPERLRAALTNAEVMDLYTRATLRDELLLASGKAVSTAWSDPRIEPSGATAPDVPDGLADKFRALEHYFSIVPTFDGIWREPQQVYAAMREAVRLDPENALYHNALGESALLLGLSHEALDAQNNAIRRDPEFARAYHARGTVQFALHLPALAAADFTEAIRLDPDNATYLVDRAAAWLLREEYASMCTDLFGACVLGECAGLEWAVTENLCSPRKGELPQEFPSSGKERGALETP